MLDYILCYGASFGLGGVCATVLIYLITERRTRRQAILEKRIKQLRRDARCHGTIG
jgi:hypothetical protein